jgi:Putative peptidoglycan binding domain
VRAVRREIARRAGYEAAGPLDFTDTKTLHAAENLYLERVGNRLELQALRAREARYGAALVDALAAKTPVESGTAESLAHTRAEAVRAALLEHGVDPSRVALEPPAAEKAAKEGVPTQLSLTTDAPAQSEAQGAPPPAVKDDLVRDVQGRLDSAGFAPGPVDGKLGPLTQRALRNFQEARGLEATGALDARTLAALGLQREAAAGATRR